MSQIHLLPLLLYQEVQQVGSTHESVCFRKRFIDHGNLFPVGQDLIEVLNFFSFQEARVGLITFL